MLETKDSSDCWNRLLPVSIFGRHENLLVEIFSMAICFEQWLLLTYEINNKYYNDCTPNFQFKVEDILIEEEK